MSNGKLFVLIFLLLSTVAIIIWMNRVKKPDGNLFPQSAENLVENSLQVPVSHGVSRESGNAVITPNGMENAK